MKATNDCHRSALEAFEGGELGSIEVFVNPMWWGGLEKEAAHNIAVETGTSHRGLARIMPGGQRVHISFPSFNSYPLVQVTPQGDVGDGWWTDNYNQDGFDIFLKGPLFHPVTFNWRVEPTDLDQNKIFLSDGTTAEFNRMTGQTTASQEQRESNLAFRRRSRPYRSYPRQPRTFPRLPHQRKRNHQRFHQTPHQQANH